VLLWAAAAHAALGEHDGLAVSHLPAREPAGRNARQLLGRCAGGQAAPRRTAVLGSDGWRVGPEAHGQVLWRAPKHGAEENVLASRTVEACGEARGAEFWFEYARQGSKIVGMSRCTFSTGSG
jgi:hypothetical protein